MLGRVLIVGVVKYGFRHHPPSPAIAKNMHSEIPVLVWSETNPPRCANISNTAAPEITLKTRSDGNLFSSSAVGTPRTWHKSGVKKWIETFPFCLRNNLVRLVCETVPRRNFYNWHVPRTSLHVPRNVYSARCKNLTAFRDFEIDFVGRIKLDALDSLKRKMKQN